MLRFAELEQLGVRCAAISDKTDGDCAREGRAAFCTACGADSSAVHVLRQVHSDRVLDAANLQQGTQTVEADGVVSNAWGTAMGIWVADCVPLFLYDPVRSAGGVIHAGREGTRTNIAARAVEKLMTLGVEPKNLHAVIGPSAGPCCYEVSLEMTHEFRALGLPTTGRNLDLWEANAQQLRAAGLPSAQITSAQICTICDGRLHSYRADKSQSRNFALLVL